MTKLVTDQKFKFGQKNVIPFAGEVQISDEGIIEVEDSIAQSIVDAEVGFKLLEEAPKKAESKKVEVKEPIKLKAEENVPLGEGIQSGDNQNTEETKPEAEQVVNEEVEVLKTFNMTQLQELAKKFDQKEWVNLKKVDLLKYLTDKIVNSGN